VMTSQRIIIEALILLDGLLHKKKRGSVET